MAQRGRFHVSPEAEHALRGFQAEQVATALAQALEAERERIRKQEENALAQTARANELEEAYKKRAEELERTAMEAAARVREESLKQVQEVTEMFVKSLAAGTAVERAAAAELVSRGLTGASTDAIAGGTEVEGAFGSPASVERPKEEEEDEDEEDGVVPTMDAARDPDLVLAEFDAAAEAIFEMRVRGAPLIGATAAYGVALALRDAPDDDSLQRALSILFATRPTAVNLRWALTQVTDAVRHLAPRSTLSAAGMDGAQKRTQHAKICACITPARPARGRPQVPLRNQQSTPRAPAAT